MNIDREKMLETANELLSGQVGSTPASRAINRLAGAVLMHGLMASADSTSIHDGVGHPGPGAGFRAASEKVWGGGQPLVPDAEGRS